jgi:hypothetical protein
MSVQRLNNKKGFIGLIIAPMFQTCCRSIPGYDLAALFSFPSAKTTGQGGTTSPHRLQSVYSRAAKNNFTYDLHPTDKFGSCPSQAKAGMNTFIGYTPQIVEFTYYWPAI